MGPEEIHTQGVEQKAQAIRTEEAEEEENASYDIISFPSAELPEDYKGLVYSRWLRSHRYGNFLFKMVDSDVYYDRYSKYIDTLLAKPESKVRLAVLSDNHDVALGFCVHRNDILDYVHVHYGCRSAGIASNLVPDKISYITHYTYMGSRFVTDRYGGFRFNPYL